MQSDARGFRIAVVPDDLVNRAASGFDVLGVLERADWGAIVLPPAWYPDDAARELLVQFAEHIEEFVRHGYDVVCIGSCDGLRDPLESLGIAMPDSIAPASETELTTFLLSRRIPPRAA
jgi:hypothetical protein